MPCQVGLLFQTAFSELSDFSVLWDKITKEDLKTKQNRTEQKPLNNLGYWSTKIKHFQVKINLILVSEVAITYHLHKIVLIFLVTI